MVKHFNSLYELVAFSGLVSVRGLVGVTQKKNI